MEKNNDEPEFFRKRTRKTFWERTDEKHSIPTEDNPCGKTNDSQNTRFQFENSPQAEELTNALISQLVWESEPQRGYLSSNRQHSIPKEANSVWQKNDSQNTRFQFESRAQEEGLNSHRIDQLNWSVKNFNSFLSSSDVRKKKKLSSMNLSSLKKLE